MWHCTGRYLDTTILAYDAGLTKITLDTLEAKRGVKIYRPNADELKLWRKWAVGVWASDEFKGSFDTKTVRRILNEQGNDAFIKDLEAAGVV